VEIPGIILLLFLLIGLTYNENALYGVLNAADILLDRLRGYEEEVVLNENTAEIHIIDIGQADAIVVTCGDRAMLVDAGESDTADVVIDYIDSLGIKQLDKVVATHPHSDHIGGMEDVLDAIKVKEMVMPYALHETRMYESLLAKIGALEIPIHEPEPGETVQFGDAKLFMLSPAPETEWEEVNNESIVFIFEYNGVRMLFTGDAETEAENVILEKGYDIDCDLMKVGHHGSKTSSGERFLDAVSPDYGFVTCEVGSKDNLPVESVLDRYRQRDCTLYRTDRNGTIIISIDETGEVEISCASDEK